MSALRRLYSVGTADNLSKSISSNLFIGAQAKLRKELKDRALDGVKVAVLHNDSRAVLSAKILTDNGAKVSHFGVKGLRQPSCSNIRELDLNSEEGRDYFYNILRKCDILVEGVGPHGLSKLGLDNHTLTKKNGQLIVANVEADDAFTAMDTVKTIALGLYLREKHTSGHVVETGGSERYLDELKNYSKEVAHQSKA
ncbi:hypothetical protein Q1695_000430 [Nippostrongylus brasiliensis]|nr:hypothetical protein Q1695_000430 [Nippostrongylus brasiliensis]